MKKSKTIFIVLILLLLTCVSASAQNSRRARRQAARASREGAGTVEAVADSMQREHLDSLNLAKERLRASDSLARADSLTLLSKSSITVPVFTSAGDSIVEDFSNGQRLIYYYGGVKVEYQDMSLTADYMEYDMATGVVYARGTLDTLTGEWKGQPEMKQGKDNYVMEEVRYNFNSGKSFITNMLTHDDEGILHGRSIKMMPDKSINIKNGRYTVCDDEDHPHYYLNLSSAKVITRPSQKIVFGPAWPTIEDVPLPIALPFGFVPEKPQRATGFLMPTFGEETARGFYMKDAGMYFVIGDFFDLSVTGDYYTLGSWALDVNSRYKVNYKFNGGFGLSISNDQTGEKGSKDFFQTRNFSLKWNHSQDSKARPGTSFSASVNFSSPSNSKYNSRSVTEAVQNQASSSISYSKNWNGRFNLSVNALHSQNSRDSSYTFTLPNITFSVSTFYPFKRKVRIGKERVYEKISFGYNTSLQNKVGFKMSDLQGGLTPEFLDKFQNGMAHNFSIGLPAFSLFKYINVSPGVSYGMNWFFRKSEYVYDPETDRPVIVQGRQFGTFGVTQRYSGSASVSTRLYGMYNFGKFHRVQAIRHVISPSMSLSVSPELGTPANGWRTLTYTDNKGQEKEYSYNIYAGQLNSPPGKGKSASASLSIGNNIEAKVRDFADTTGKGTKKVKLIDQLNFSTGYNFLADSLNMSNVGVTMNTQLFGKVTISANANFDPYAINERGQRINTFNFLKHGLAHPLRLTGASASMSYSINGKGSINGNDGSNGGKGGGGSHEASRYYRNYYHPVTGEYIPGGWMYYTNPNSPWSLSFSYSFSYSKSYSFSNNQLVTNNRFTQTLSMNGNIKVTPKLSVNATSGFDLMARKLTMTQFSATYDLHCFNMAISWVPTGQWQSYSFRIAANASTLADLLKFKKTSSYWDR
ncbi:MAG: LPS-assembly protein LptD [Bacteroidales bacterium]|nr:LPS-assembly protein LptD [Bacteroidales bacterium]